MNITRLCIFSLLFLNLSACGALNGNSEELKNRVSEIEAQNAKLQTELEALRAQVKGLVAVTSSNAVAIDAPKKTKAATASKSDASDDKKGDALDENIEVTLDRFETCDEPCAASFKNISRKTMRKLAVNPGASASIRACASRCPSAP